jgi:hypothetical protein
VSSGYLWVRPSTARSAPALMIERRDRADNTASTDTKDPTDKTDTAEPIEPIDSTEPIEPIESSDPRDPMHSMESCDHSDHFEFMRTPIVERARCFYRGSTYGGS